MASRLFLGSLVFALLCFQGTVTAVSLTTDQEVYHEGEYVKATVIYINGSITFQVVWNETTMIIEQVDSVNGTATLEFKIPTDTYGRWDIHGASRDITLNTTIAVIPDPSSSDNVEIIPLVNVLVIIVILGAIGSTWGIEASRWQLLGLFLPLYSRRSEDATVHKTRGKIFGVVLSEPGINYGSIRRKLKLPNGTAAYHLKVLEDENEIVSLRDGYNRRFYPKGKIEIGEGSTPGLNNNQIKLLNQIEEHPGLSQKEIAQRMNWSQQRVSYNLGRLLDMGYVDEDVRRVKRYFIKNAPVSFTCPSCDNQFTSDRVPKYCPHCGFNLDSLDE